MDYYDIACAAFHHSETVPNNLGQPDENGEPIGLVKSSRCFTLSADTMSQLSLVSYLVTKHLRRTDCLLFENEAKADMFENLLVLEMYLRLLKRKSCEKVPGSIFATTQVYLINGKFLKEIITSGVEKEMVQFEAVERAVTEDWCFFVSPDSVSEIRKGVAVLKFSNCFDGTGPKTPRGMCMLLHQVIFELANSESFTQHELRKLCSDVGFTLRERLQTKEDLFDFVKGSYITGL